MVKKNKNPAKKNLGELFIATPAYGGQVSTGYTLSLLATLNLLRTAGINNCVHMIGNESLISRARNSCASVARSRKSSKLLFIDADMSWDSNMVYRLFQSDKLVVGGSCPKKAFPIDFAFNVLDEDVKYFNGPKDKASIMKWVANSPSNTGKGEMKVKQLGTGFLMIDMRVFERMVEEIPEEVPIYLPPGVINTNEMRDFFPVKVVGDRLMAEDWSFCNNCRKLGIDIHFDVMCLCEHTGTFTWKPDMTNDQSTWIAVNEIKK